MSIATAFDLNESWLNSEQQFIAGIECEIESVRNPHDGFAGFEPTEDGSLRNNGVEFISIPLSKHILLDNFTNLHANLEFHNRQDAFSPRTSTHVHINCRSLDFSHVKTLVLLYALYEDFFFAMCEPGRRDNIHCVPLTETFLPTLYKKELRYLIQGWHKYTALNILPLTKIGTVEFRHLQGTDDVALLKDWLTTLENLWSLAQRETITEQSLCDEAIITRWWWKLFGHSTRIAPLAPSINNVIAGSLIDVKFALI